MLKEVAKKPLQPLEKTFAENAQTLYNTMQTSKQSVQDNVSKLRILATRAFPNATVDQLAAHIFEQLRKGLNPKLRSSALAVLANVNQYGQTDAALTEAIAILRRIEHDLHGEERSTDRANDPSDRSSSNPKPTRHYPRTTTQATTVVVVDEPPVDNASGPEELPQQFQELQACYYQKEAQIEALQGEMQRMNPALQNVMKSQKEHVCMAASPQTQNSSPQTS